ncbi:hypothetical protein GQ568_02660 [Patescibacteria group bacterium]|nr:hypothetical protein [Patescibacteria group bacterium]
MALSTRNYPKFKGVQLERQTISPDDSQEVANSIRPGVRSVRLATNINGTNDFVVLPSLADVEDGHQIIIIAGAANCELRTPDASAEEINSEDCDGTKELLITATQIVYVTKIDSTIGWMCNPFTAIGAVATAVVPD